MPGGWYSSSHYLIMNKAKYDALPAEDKAIVDKHSGVAFAKMAGAGWDKINAWGLEKVKEAGNTIKTAPDGTVKALETLNEDFLKAYFESASDIGVDGQATYEYFKSEVDSAS